MTMSEIANAIEFLQKIGWTDAQITNFLLSVEGRRSLEDGARVHREEEKKEG